MCGRGGSGASRGLAQPGAAAISGAKPIAIAPANRASFPRRAAALLTRVTKRPPLAIAASAVLGVAKQGETGEQRDHRRRPAGEDRRNHLSVGERAAQLVEEEDREAQP